MEDKDKRMKVLFLCSGNSCRSQMAEGWTKKLKGDVIDAYSAGIEKHGIDASAAAVMKEVGIDISGNRSKTVEDLQGIDFDYVITLCGYASENLPAELGQIKRVHRRFVHPMRLALGAENQDEELEAYRKIRDEIREFVASLPEYLLNAR
ncbi:MAG: Arsenate-mycothiol transferase ArsC1 [Firmicutes bacterium ADurb.Bin153]|nr:MAG: Arsenate-mycothiol transferase ArsC1 [Firmicutes bacterium ADurb.Bin153]